MGQEHPLILEFVAQIVAKTVKVRAEKRNVGRLRFRRGFALLSDRVDRCERRD